MKYVRLTLDAGGQEAEIHPMFDVLINAAYVDRALALHWTFVGDELGMMHYVEGSRGQFRETLERIPEVTDYALTPDDGGSFYAYVRDSTTEPVREMFGPIQRCPAVVLPPVEYADGTVSYAVFGPPDEIQGALERFPPQIDVTVSAVSGLSALAGTVESSVTDRQREALETALEVGYYEVPREANHEAVAEEIGCAPSTAAEHLRRGEANVLHAAIDGPMRWA
ncbi:helix-turn-helix domain-containing protein [Natrarchaeobius chitinivorans]|uniref:Helix-turn-helix domain-containing protein n=1 Tax=Natrarchaeobius chitinivorans TaxID=1679083 RepID=A0A3N6M5E4_NATCH|nr:helix-turn-helix domain-containing protein [Natrarchaeobius chitinivorans]RQG90491.1 helix-turn-helix domain-containing protein [Natrarchaeobius chitinivorans]